MNEIEQIELRRLHELRKQAAMEGPHTPPHVLIEIQDILNRHPEQKRARQPDERRALDYDFLMNSVAAALQRLTLMEQRHDRDEAQTITRQRLLIVWLVILTAMAFANLVVLSRM